MKQNIDEMGRIIQDISVIKKNVKDDIYLYISECNEGKETSVGLDNIKTLIERITENDSVNFGNEVSRYEKGIYKILYELKLVLIEAGNELKPRSLHSALENFLIEIYRLINNLEEKNGGYGYEFSVEKEIANANFIIGNFNRIKNEKNEKDLNGYIIHLEKLKEKVNELKKYENENIKKSENLCHEKIKKLYKKRMEGEIGEIIKKYRNFIGEFCLIDLNSKKELDEKTNEIEDIKNKYENFIRISKENKFCDVLISVDPIYLEVTIMDINKYHSILKKLNSKFLIKKIDIILGEIQSKKTHNHICVGNYNEEKEKNRENFEKIVDFLTQKKESFSNIQKEIKNTFFDIHLNKNKEVKEVIKPIIEIDFSYKNDVNENHYQKNYFFDNDSSEEEKMNNYDHDDHSGSFDFHIINPENLCDQLKNTKEYKNLYEYSQKTKVNNENHDVTKGFFHSMENIIKKESTDRDKICQIKKNLDTAKENITNSFFSESSVKMGAFLRKFYSLLENSIGTHCCELLKSNTFKKFKNCKSEKLNNLSVTIESMLIDEGSASLKMTNISRKINDIIKDIEDFSLEEKKAIGNMLRKVEGIIGKITSGHQDDDENGFRF